MTIKTSDEKMTKSLPSNFTGNTGGGVADLAVPTQLSASSSLNEILAFARQQKASDVHVGAKKPIIFRQFGQLKSMISTPLAAEHVNALISAVMPQDVLDVFDQTGDVEYIHTINGFGRYRMTIMKQRDGCDLTARLIPMEIPKFEDSGMMASCADLTKWAQGMVLITGPAGCGKTTTLAILVDLINQTRHDHIVTLEAPIEIVYEPKQCQITQREIHTHTLSQHSALRAALREDPDILIVSELRDLDSLQLAISAAETGHLVFGTMNTTSAAQTVSSLIDSFPAEEQSIIRNMISESLRGVITQQLIPKKDGSGMVPAYEVLIVTPPVANMIRSNKIAQVNNTITTSKNSGMILMDNSLEILAKNNVISKKDACERSLNPATMVQLLAGGGTIAKSKFLDSSVNGVAILSDLVQFGVLEEFSVTEVRLKPGIPLDENFIKKIANTDFDKIWPLLQ